jgi:hypothetical protein
MKDMSFAHSADSLTALVAFYVYLHLIFRYIVNALSWSGEDGHLPKLLRGCGTCSSPDDPSMNPRGDRDQTYIHARCIEPCFRWRIESLDSTL